MIINIFFSSVLILVITSASAQNKTKEIGFTTDNDLYTSIINDKYYTNGFDLFYRFLAQNNKERENKKVIELRLGQYIYTPRTITIKANDITTNDRPFAGYLFSEVGRTIFYQNEQVFKTYFQLGFIGQNSFAKEVQEQFHKSFKYPTVHGWQNQIKNILAIQTYFLYSTKLFPIKSNFINFNFQTEANLGTVFTGVSTGFLTRIGLKKLVQIYDSNIHGASINVNSEKKINELYFYIAPAINYQLYDASIQGGLLDDMSPVKYDIIPFRFNAKIGLKYKINNINLSYTFVYKSKELKNDINTDYYYGSIQFSYLLH